MAKDQKDETGRALALGTVGAFAVNLAGTALLVVMHMALARAMGADAYGTLSLALSWIAILGIVVSLGLDTAMVRFVAEYRVRRDWALLRGFLRSARGTVAVAGVLVGLGLVATVTAVSGRLSPATASVFRLAALVLPLLVMAQLFQAELRGLRQVVRGRVPLQVLRPLLVVAVVGGAYLLPGRELAASTALSLLGGAVAVALVVLVFLARSGRPAEVGQAPPAYRLKSWLRTSAPLMLVSGMRVLLNQVDIVLVGALIGAREAGIYGIATRLARFMSFGLTAGNAIAGPLIAELEAGGNRQQLQRVTRQAAWVATAAGLAIGAALVLLREDLLALFGDAFVRGGRVLAILAAGQLLNALTGPVGLLLNMTGHEDTNARIFGVITLLNAILNVPAILFVGIEGAALVTGGLIGLKNVWCWFAVRRLIRVNSSVF